jgi:hypothetical protein
MATAPPLLDQLWSKRVGEAVKWPPFTGMTAEQRARVMAGVGATPAQSTAELRQAVTDADAVRLRYETPADAYQALVLPHLDDIMAADAAWLAGQEDAEEVAARIEQYQPEDEPEA